MHIKILVAFTLSYLFKVTSISFGTIPNLRLWRHSNSSLTNALNSFQKKSVNHGYGGILCSLEYGRDKCPSSFDYLNKDTIIGFGDDDFQRAKDILLNLDMINSLSWIKFASSSFLRKNENIGILINAYKVFWILNPGRISCVQHAQNCDANSKKISQVAFSTLWGHLLAGEERFRVVELDNGIVRFEVASVSKGKGIIGEVVMPLIRPLQMKFLNDVSQSMKNLLDDSTYKPKPVFYS